jgi:CRP-like cAMP-binding protein
LLEFHWGFAGGLIVLSAVPSSTIGPLRGAVCGDKLCQLPGACADCPLRPIAVCGDVSDRIAERIDALRQPHRQFPARRVVFHEGDRLRQIYQLFDGWACRYKVLKDGRRQILSFLLPGDSLNMPSLYRERAGYSVKTLTPISVCVFNTPDLSDFIRANPPIAERAAHFCADAGADADERLLDLGRRSAFDRVRRLLAGIVQRLQQRGFAGPAYPLPLTQLHIADATGLTPVHVGRILGEMRRHRLLDQTRGRLTLHDQDWLLGTAR